MTAQTFSITRRGTLGFKTIHWCLCICFQSDAYLYLRLELGVFITQQLVPFWCLENNNKPENTLTVNREKKALEIFFNKFTIVF
jgi:hypothetical protein